MKVKELIEYLQKVENQESKITIEVKQYNRAYPVAYLPINKPYYETFKRFENEVRIEISLPVSDKEFMFTGIRKLK